MTDLVKKATRYVIRDRSNYQLKHFVIGQHDTPEMQFRQILLEARDMLHKIRGAEIGYEITKIKIEKLKAKKDRVSLLKAAKLELDLEMSASLLEAAHEELDYLVELSKDYRHYTPTEIEANQQDYWKARLTRQAETDRLSLEHGVGVGNLESLMKAGLYQKELKS